MSPEDVDILVTLGVECPKEAQLPSFGTCLSIRATKWCIGFGGGERGELAVGAGQGRHASYKVVSVRSC